MWLESNKTVRTKSGRTIVCPKIDCSTNLRTASTIKRVHDWMVREALLELGPEKDMEINPARLGVASMNPGRLTDSDVQLLNYILFDEG